MNSQTIKQRAEILQDIALIDRKIWRFKKQKNKPPPLLKRLRDNDITRLKEDIDRYNLSIDLRQAQRDAEVLNAYIENATRTANEVSRPSLFRRSYAFEAWCEGLAIDCKRLPQFAVDLNIKRHARNS